MLPWEDIVFIFQKWMVYFNILPNEVICPLRIFIQMYLLKPKVIANITENNTVQKEVWVAVGKFISIHWKNQKSNYLCAMIYMANILCTFFFLHWLKITVILLILRRLLSIQNHAEGYKTRLKGSRASLLTKWFCKHQCVYKLFRLYILW